MIKEEKEPQFRLSDEPIASEIKTGVLVATKEDLIEK